MDQLQTHMTIVNGQLSLCFDKIEKLEGKHDDGEGFLSDDSLKGKLIDDEDFKGEGSHNGNPFLDHSSNMLAWLLKVDLNKFDGSDLVGGDDQVEHYFSLHAIGDDPLKLRLSPIFGLRMLAMVVMA